MSLLGEKRHVLKPIITVAAAAGLIGALATPASAVQADSVAAGTPTNSSLASLLNPEPAQQFIVGYENSAAGAQAQQAAQATLQRSLATAADATGIQLTAGNALATGGNLVKAPRQLNNAEVANVIESLSSTPGVAYAELDATLTKLTNDPLYNTQWGVQDNVAGVDAPGGWSNAGRGGGNVVAVIDTGITSHPDLNPNIVAGYDFISSAATARDGNGRDSNPQDEGDWNAAGECGRDSRASNSSWHGTHVAGIVGAVADNNQGITGVAPNSRIQPVRVLGKCGGSTSDIAEAVVWASGGSVSGVPANRTPAKVINLSLGGSGACSTTMQNAINGAVNRGTTVVVAAGNEQRNVSNSNPANCNNVVAVAAIDRNGDRAFYSNFGAQIDVAAPGGDTRTSGGGINATLNNGTTTPGSPSYAYYQGTSMAAPHVAGVAALMQGRGWSPATIESRLKSTSRPITGNCSQCGAGYVDAFFATQ